MSKKSCHSLFASHLTLLQHICQAREIADRLLHQIDQLPSQPYLELLLRTSVEESQALWLIERICTDRNGPSPALFDLALVTLGAMLLRLVDS